MLADYWGYNRIQGEILDTHYSSSCIALPSQLRQVNRQLRGP